MLEKLMDIFNLIIGIIFCVVLFIIIVVSLSPIGIALGKGVNFFFGTVVPFVGASVVLLVFLAIVGFVQFVIAEAMKPATYKDVQPWMIVAQVVLKSAILAIIPYLFSSATWTYYWTPVACVIMWLASYWYALSPRKTVEKN